MSCRAVDLRTGPSKGLFAPFLHVLLHELFGVLLEHVVDLVEQGVQLLLELLALLGYLGRRLNVRLLGFLLAVRAPLLLGATTVLGHRPLLVAGSMIVSRRADGIAQSRTLWITAAPLERVPRTPPLALEVADEVFCGRARVEDSRGVHGRAPGGLQHRPAGSTDRGPCGRRGTGGRRAAAWRPPAPGCRAWRSAA